MRKILLGLVKPMHFSRAGLIDQLESPYGDQFTHAQAVYGVNHVGPWPTP